MRYAALFVIALALGACADSPLGTTSSDPAATGTPSGTSDLPSAARPEPSISATCPAGTSSSAGALPGSGALFLFCLPPSLAWNGSVIVYAHGYVNPFDNLAIVDDVVGGLPISQIVTSAGFAFATTSYRNTGLILFEAEQDLLRVVHEFERQFGKVPGRVLVAGVSEGAAVAVLAGERYPQLFDGVLAVCGPIGDFRGQLNHLDDFRVLFDVFFPGVIPGSPIAIPADVIEAWLAGSLRQDVLDALAANPANAVALFASAGITLPPGPPPSYVAEFTIRLLAYNVLGTNDVNARIGQPYDNTETVYLPPAVNALVERFAAEQRALSELKKYETDGKLQLPVVTIHNLSDPIVPFEQVTIYEQKVEAAGAGAFLTAYPVPLGTPFGHCVFTLEEVQGALALLLSQVNQPAGLAAR
jgi:pimeloyl-ACP methyl ester carboxylesterase